LWIGALIDDLRKLILGQPTTTMIGIGHLRNGTVDILQDLISDHALAAKALRLPTGSSSSAFSPYNAITDLIKRWPESINTFRIS
jgi:hypothetical protein